MLERGQSWMFEPLFLEKTCKRSFIQSVSSRFCPELLSRGRWTAENVSLRTGLGSTWRICCDNESCPFPSSSMYAGIGLLAVAPDRFLFFGIFINVILAIIIDKVIKMFSLRRVIWTIWEVSQMIQCLLTPKNKLLNLSWKWLFPNEIVSHCRENLSVSCYLSNYCSRKLILSFIDQHFICLMPRCN